MPRNLKPSDVEWRSGITATREDAYSTPIALKMPGQPVNQMQKIIDTTRRLSATSALSISIKTHSCKRKRQMLLIDKLGSIWVRLPCVRVLLCFSRKLHFRFYLPFPSSPCSVRLSSISRQVQAAETSDYLNSSTSVTFTASSGIILPSFRE